MICYYIIQTKKNGVWESDKTQFPIAIRQEDARLLIEDLYLGDNTRLIRIQSIEAICNCTGQILWYDYCYGKWVDSLLPVVTKPGFLG